MSELVVPHSGSIDTFNEYTTSNEFLSRLQLFQGSSTVCKEGKIRPGNYGIPQADENIIDLGDSVDLYVLAYRPKAFDCSNKEALIVNYEPDSEVFKDIKERASQKNSGCMYGLTFLVLERNTQDFYEYYASSVSARSEAKKFRPFLARTEDDVAREVAYAEANNLDASKIQPAHGAKPVTMRSFLKKNVQNPYHVPVIVACSTPFTSLPGADIIQRKLDLFFSAKSTEVELAEEQSVVR